MNMKLRNIPFSPPDMTEAEVKEVREAILSGWITTGPRTTYIPASIHNEAMLSGAWTSIAQ
jgi:dTDP-4-amino-4,6-dideoxygalactose transaminase